MLGYSTKNRLIKIFIALYISLIVIYIVAPNIIVLVMSFNREKYFLFPPTHWSIKWFQRAFSIPSWRRAFFNSLALAFITAFTSTALGIITGLALHRGRFRVREALSSFFLSPLLMPQLLLGIALMFFLGNLGLIGSLAPLFIGHVLVTFPFVLRLILAALPTVSVNVEEAAYTLGANEITTIIKVTLPMIRSTVLSGWMFAFILSFDNLMISLFLATVRVNTLPVKILETLEWELDPTVAAVSSIFMVMTFGIMLILDRTVGLRFDTGATTRG